MTLAGAVTLVDELDIETIRPPTGAGPLRVTVPVDEPPGATVAGLSLSEVRVGGTIASTAVLDVDPFLAVRVAVVLVATALVVTANVTELAPAPIVTVFGTVTTALLLDSATTKPPGSAFPLRVTVPIEVLPPVTLLGLTATDESVGRVMVSVADWVPPLRLAVIVAVTEALTALVVIVNVPDVLPP